MLNSATASIHTDPASTNAAAVNTGCGTIFGFVTGIKAFKRTRFLLVLLIVSAASAQAGRPDPGCARGCVAVLLASDGPGRHGHSGMSQAKPRAVEQELREVLADNGQ
jgi:hypothetical protein